jgi:DNA-binding SARP family transcriptional activator/WD40 repeat protein
MQVTLGLATAAQLQHHRETLRAHDRGGSIEVDVLGTLRVRHRGQPIDIGGPQQRRVLAVLTMAGGAPVAVGTIAEAVFDGRGAQGAESTLRSYVTRLRRSLGADGTRLVTREAGGYRLDTTSLTLDSHRFSRLVVDARRQADRGEHWTAASTLQQALDLWRGPAYADFADEMWARPSIQRLADERHAAYEALADCEMAQGNSRAVVGMLRGLLTDDPFREGLVSRLVLALYRDGRPSDALEVYRSYRDRLRDELGIDPGGDLERLHERVLARDPALDVVQTAGRAFRGYLLGERLGRGRAGTVYAATMPGSSRAFAIRVYDADVADDPEVVRTFEADVRLLRSVDEPALVGVYDGWREPGTAALVMRRMTGTLADELDNGPLNPTRSVEVVERVAAALLALARRGRIHGRVRPSSVLTDNEGTAFLAEPVLSGQADRGGTADDARDFARLVVACRPQQAEPWLLDLTESTGRDLVDTVETVLRALSTAPAAPVNPYVGLRPFEMGDSDRFFGREELVTDLLARVDRARPRLTLVVGGSGSGKSSVVRAGVLPALVRGEGRWLTTLMVPGADPMAGLRAALRRISLDSHGDELRALAERSPRPVLLVVDQLDEVFSVAPPDRREAFLSVLADVATQPDGRVHVLATLRADVFDAPLGFSRFGEVAAKSVVALPSMTPGQLERTISGPAGHWTLDEGLAADLVASVADEPGALPALQFTLHALAEIAVARGQAHLSRDDLHSIGGVEGAIAHRAESMYDALDADGQALLRRVLKRLVVVDSDGNPGSRASTRGALRTLDLDPDAVETLLDTWVDSRILATGRRPGSREPTVELAHEAVLSRWPRLREWIDTDRERLLGLARLEQSAQEWVDSGRDSAALLRGGRLEQAEALLAGAQPSTQVRGFVTAGQQLRDDERRLSAAARQAETRTARRLRRQRWMLAAALVIAIGVGWVAIEQRGAALARAEQEADRAAAGAAALSAAAANASRSDWSLGLLLAVEAHALDPSPSTRRALLAALLKPGPVPTTLWTSEQSLRQVVADPAGGLVATRWASGPVDLIDIDERKRVGGLNARGTGGIDLRDGLLVVAGSDGGRGQVHVVRGSDEQVVARLADGIAVTDVALSPDSSRLAVADSAGSVGVFATDSWERVASLTGPDASPVQQVTWSQSGADVYAFTASGAFLAWRGAEDARRAASPSAVVGLGTDRTALFSREAPLVSGEDLGALDLQDVPDTPLVLVVTSRQDPAWVDVEARDWFYLLGPGHRGSTLGGAVDAAGTHVLAHGSSLVAMDLALADGGTNDWSATVAVDAIDVDMLPDGRAVSVGSNGTVTAWRLPRDIPGLEAVPTLDGAEGVNVEPGGSTALVWGKGGATLLDGRTWRPLGELDLGFGEDSVLSVASRPDQDGFVVHACTTPPERRWAACPSALAAYGLDGRLAAGPIAAGLARPSGGSSVATAPGLLASVEASGRVTLRDPGTLEPLATRRPPSAADTHEETVLTVSSDGTKLVLATQQPDSVTMWRLDGRDAAVLHDTDLDGATLLSDDILVATRGADVIVYDADSAESLNSFPQAWRQGDLFAPNVVPEDAPVSSAARAAPLVDHPSWSADGSLMLAGEPGFSWLWDATAPSVVAGPLRVDAAMIDAVGDRLLVWDDGAASVMPLAPDDLVATACSAAGRALTEQEWTQSIGPGEPYAPTCSGT